MNEQTCAIPQLANDEVERYVLGVMITYNEFYHQYAALLSPDLFYSAKNARLFTAVRSLLDGGGAADMSVVAVWFMQHPDPQNPDVVYIMDCTNSVYQTATFGQSVDILTDLRMRRELRTLALKMMQASCDMSIPVASLQQKVSKIQELDKPKKLKDKSLEQANRELTEMINKARSGERPQNIYTTGFSHIDEIFAFSATELEIIAAETAMGKSVLCSNVAVNMARQGTPCYYISLEMRSVHMAARINAPLAKVSASKMMKHPESLTPEELHGLEDAQKITSQLPVLFDEDVALTPESVIRSIRDKAKRGYKVFFVDYVQQLVQNVEEGSAEQLLGAFIRKLKNLAMELDVCIVAVSQLNRDKLNPRPTLSRLRGSGQLEETANNILFIWRPTARGLHFSPAIQDEENRAEFIVGKARDASSTSFYMGFDGRLTTFYDLDKQPYFNKPNKSNNINTDYTTRNYGTSQQSGGASEDNALPF